MVETRRINKRLTASPRNVIPKCNLKSLEGRVKMTKAILWSGSQAFSTMTPQPITLLILVALA